MRGLLCCLWFEIIFTPLLVTSGSHSTATGGGTDVPHEILAAEYVTVVVQARSASGFPRDTGKLHHQQS